LIIKRCLFVESLRFVPSQLESQKKVCHELDEVKKSFDDVVYSEPIPENERSIKNKDYQSKFTFIKPTDLSYQPNSAFIGATIIPFLQTF